MTFQQAAGSVRVQDAHMGVSTLGYGPIPRIPVTTKGYINVLVFLLGDFNKKNHSFATIASDCRSQQIHMHA